MIHEKNVFVGVHTCKNMWAYSHRSAIPQFPNDIYLRSLFYFRVKMIGRAFYLAWLMLKVRSYKLSAYLCSKRWETEGQSVEDLELLTNTFFTLFLSLFFSISKISLHSSIFVVFLKNQCLPLLWKHFFFNIARGAKIS